MHIICKPFSKPCQQPNTNAGSAAVFTSRHTSGYANIIFTYKSMEIIKNNVLSAGKRNYEGVTKN